MGTLYENIKYLCDQKGIKPGKMCVEAGVSKGLITDLKMGRKKSIRIETAAKIAEYFDVPTDFLLKPELYRPFGRVFPEKLLTPETLAFLEGGEAENEEEPTVDDDDELSDSQKALMRFVETVPPEKAGLVLRVMKSILEDDKE